MKQIQNQMKYSITSLLNALLAKADIPYVSAQRFLIHEFQQYKFSSCCTLLHSSLYTHSSSFDDRQCGDSRYSILLCIKYASFVVVITYWAGVHCGSLPTCCA
jgi:hypothetical protein